MGFSSRFGVPLLVFAVLFASISVVWKFIVDFNARGNEERQEHNGVELVRRIMGKCKNAAETGDVDLGEIHISGESLTFLTLGDWGVYDLDNHMSDMQSLLRLARVMDGASGNKQPHFVVSLGDHYYASGQQSKEKTLDEEIVGQRLSKWRTALKQIFSGFTLRNTLFFAIAGNCDYSSGTVDGQMQHTVARGQNRWCFPLPFYTITFVVKPATSNRHSTRRTPFGSSLFQWFLRPQTNHSTDDRLEKSKEFKVKLIFLDTNRLDSSQMRWLRSTLLRAKREAQWVVVCGHHPMEAGIGDCKQPPDTGIYNFDRNLYTANASRLWREEMKQVLGELMAAENVGLYVSGHHHLWRLGQVHRDDSNTPLWLAVLGSAGRIDGHYCSEWPPHKIHGGSHISFARVRVSQTQLEFSVTDSHNRTLLRQTQHRLHPSFK